MPIRGSIDRLDELLLEGWVLNDDHPESKLAFDVLVNDKVIGRFVADLFRQDLKDADIADGECAFSFQMPQFFGQQDLANLKLRFADSNIFVTLPGATKKEETVRATVSRVGGLWIDRSDFIDQVGAKHRAGTLSDALATRLFQFARDGYTVIEKAVAPKLIDRLRGELDELWHTPPAGLLIETFEPDGMMRYIPPDSRWRDGRSKLLDAYARSEAARQVIAAPAVMEFLTALFEDKPKAFQSLNFHRGLQQAMHKDTAYVKVDGNPLAMAASWTALEDIEAGTGEPEYFIGSHRAPDFLFGGFSKWMENFTEEHQAYLDSLLADAKTYNQTRGKFLAKKGDVLIWHADLANGAAAVTQAARTRQSLVTHFCPAKLEPFYRRTAAHDGRSTPACDFVSQYLPVK
ncbi:phytanoyl-CoA dioxygenase family protein [Siccirubricoccus phaeus]|uniref:phytanoyl-CoA dioxygenase family protein n=1 Tax=Siccirubricoccus phaeus TaxID=2595053 RepID=UPI0011F3D724|nr:phytanoyl-CoA dioxygenase family protein [Siccirubricoccus phaeus]